MSSLRAAPQASAGSTVDSPSAEPLRLPFDQRLLDDLLSDAGIDLALVTSAHNLRYLLGGYRFFFFAHLDAIALSRYLPVLAYPRSRPEDSLYVGAGNEDWETDIQPVWVPRVRNVAWTAEDAAREAADHLKALGLTAATIGVEPAHLPIEAADVLRSESPAATLVDVSGPLEELRAIKREHELTAIREGSEAVVEAMLATFEASRVGDTKQQIAERLRQQQTLRGLSFDYCLVASGPDLNRAPSPQLLAPGALLSLDSGANRAGYVADLARMGVAGTPTARQEELLEQVESVQQTARRTIAAGVRGGEVLEAGRRALGDCQDRARMAFQAHGCGLVTHEAPRLMSDGSPPYPAAHADRPLAAGMVLSLETHVADPETGFVKLEDTVIVRDGRGEPVADHGRGFNGIGA